MNGWEFMSDSPWLTFFLAVILANLLCKSWSMFWRHLNIRKHGWPPEHCDADGSLKDDEENGGEVGNG